MYTCVINGTKFVFSVREEKGRMSQSKKTHKGGGVDLDVHYGNSWASVTVGPDESPLETVKRLFDRLKEPGDFTPELLKETKAIAALLK